MSLAPYLIDGHYKTLLTWQFVLESVLLAGVLYRRLRLERKRCRLTGFVAMLLGLAFFTSALVFSQRLQPNVFFDEFFYVSTAQNTAEWGHMEPLYWTPAAKEPYQRHFFVPPYPQGWSFLLSWFMPQPHAPWPGVVEKAPWLTAVSVNRCLLVFIPVLAALALSRFYRRGTCWAVGLLLAALPLLRKLAWGASLEGAALLLGCLTLWAWAEWVTYQPEKSESGRFWESWLWLFLVLSASCLGEMRPEALAVGLGLVIWGFLLRSSFWPAPLGRAASALSGRAQALLAVATVPFWLVPALVMLGHDPSLDHHFQAVPRAGFTMMQNRGLNLLNDAWFFLSGSIWPQALTVLAVIGLVVMWRRSDRADESGSCWRRPQAMLAAVALFWLVGITLFLAWFPFGDYSSSHSLDTWRFGWHVVLPLLLPLGAGWQYLWQKKTLSWRLASCLLATWGMLSLVYPLQFLKQSNSLVGHFEAVERAKALVDTGTLVCEETDFYVFLRFGCGLPAVWVPEGREMDALGAGGRDESFVLWTELDEHGKLGERWKEFNCQLLWRSKVPGSRLVLCRLQ